MINIIKFNLTQYVKYSLKKAEVYVENKYYTFDEKNVYLRGVTFALDNLRVELKSICQKEEKISVSIFNYEKFSDIEIEKARKEASNFSDTVVWQAYFSAVQTVMTDLKSELTRKISKDGFVREADMKEPLETICLIWK